MYKVKNPKYILAIIVFLSLLIKLVLVFTYKNQLTLSSDDLNYVKSAVALLKNNILTYHNYNEPTVFIMPVYPMFLAAVFKIFGYGLVGLQAARIAQVILSCITIIFVFMTAQELFNTKVALLCSFLIAFYLPNITTPGYFLTETLFTAFFYALLFYSIKLGKSLNFKSSLFLGVLWALATLCRPTIAFYPLFLFAYIFFYYKVPIGRLVKQGIIMLLTFILIMTPWWIRNYREYAEFIPLSASSGNPMLQGTYVDYEQTPENIIFYKMGKNYFETNKNEMEAAKQRISIELKRDFWGYLKWYFVTKTFLLWGTVFYWKAFFGIDAAYVFVQHYVLLLGFVGIIILILQRVWSYNENEHDSLKAENFFKYFLPVSMILYFNLVHCVYMAFDRYAFPLMPILAMFSAYFIIRLYKAIKNFIF